MSDSNLLTGTFIHFGEKLDGGKVVEGFKETEITFKLAEETSVTGKGRFITPRACYEMVNSNFTKNVANKDADFNAYIIGKEAVLQIIGQEDCEGLMVLNCINDEGAKSLVFAGVDKMMKLIGNDDSFTKANRAVEFAKNVPVKLPVIIERIGSVSSKEIIEKMGTSNKNIADGAEKINVMTNTFLGIAEQ
jgi:hypothetical protein